MSKSEPVSSRSARVIGNGILPSGSRNWMKLPTVTVPSPPRAVLKCGVTWYSRSRKSPGDRRCGRRRRHDEQKYLRMHGVSLSDVNQLTLPGTHADVGFALVTLRCGCGE
jgi:hypothetical protein